MIQENLKKILGTIPENVTLIAVSKTKPDADILEAYEAGQRDFGENRVQELAGKADRLPKDIKWHQIGTLQRNKVKYIAPFVHLIHSVESERLLNEIDKQGEKNGRKIRCLLQFHIATEESKFGLDLDEAKQLLDSHTFKSMEHIEICGIMGMASFTSDANQVKREFSSLKETFNTLKQTYFSDSPHFDTISMGMSGDYTLAIEEGSTMVRVGSAIFGSR